MKSKIFAVFTLAMLTLIVFPQSCYAGLRIQISDTYNEFDDDNYFIYGDQYIKLDCTVDGSDIYDYDLKMPKPERYSCYATVGGSRYKGKISNISMYSDSCDFRVTVKITKLHKIGSKIKVHINMQFPALVYTDTGAFACSAQTANKTITKRIYNYQEEEDRAFTYDWITKNSKKIKVKWDNFRPSDVIKLKIGKKTYSKKVKTKSKTQYINIKPSKAGTKYYIWIENKFKQRIADKGTDVVYNGHTISIGMTKSQAKLITGWRYPDKKYY